MVLPEAVILEAGVVMLYWKFPANPEPDVLLAPPPKNSPYSLTVPIFIWAVVALAKFSRVPLEADDNIFNTPAELTSKSA